MNRIASVSGACRLVASLIGALLLTGCAGSIEQWIVDTRVHQGDVALDGGNPADAELSYRLALRINPKDVRAQTGFVEAAGDYAQEEYTKGDFDGGLAIIGAGLAVDPSSVRLSGLKAAIEQAKLKREIVISNYPTYRDAGLQIARAYQQLDVSNKALLKSLKSFSYTFDSDTLTAAIKQSYDLEEDIARNTNRLIVYRQVVESGVPAVAAEATTAGASSLLPLP